MRVVLSVTADDGAGELRNLYSWLIGEPGFAGLVQLHERDPGPGELGPVADLLQVAVEPGGALSAFAAVVIAWLRFRTADVNVTVTRTGADTNVEVKAERVSGLDAAGTRALADEVSRALAAGDGDAAR